jgi:hypothetical protein
MGMPSRRNALEFELQLAPGDAITGPFDIRYLRELLYSGRLTGDECVRVPGQSELVPIGEVEVFAAVLGLRSESRDTRRKPGHPFTRWRRDASAQKMQPEVEEEEFAAPKPRPRAKLPIQGIAILSSVILVITLITWWILSSR